MSLERVNIAPIDEETLKKLDLVIIVDHSGSMGDPSNRAGMKGKTRYEEVEEQVRLAANVMAKWDDDGITLIHFANAARMTDGVQADAVRQLFKEIQPGGSTMLHLALEKLEEKVQSSKKETVALVFTDGEASDSEEVLKAMNRLGNKFGRPRIGLCLIQVGDDGGATKFLDYIDNNLKVDISAHFSEEEAENLTIPQLINAARTE